MNTRKTIVAFTVISLVALVFILGGTPLSRSLVAFSQALGPQPTPAPQKTPQKLAPGSSSESLPAAESQTVLPQTLQTPEDAAVQTAFQTAVNQQRQNILGFAIFQPVVDSIHYSADGTSALIWVALRDPQTGEIIATEPGLSIARNPTKTNPLLASSWAITFQTETSFSDQLKSLPADLVTDDIRNSFLQPQQNQAVAAAAAPLTGYKLPWTAGLSKKVTNSIGHYLSVSGGFASCPTTCQYAFDFADGTMFPILAAKGGVVQAFKWTCANNDHSCTNYLILRDESTIPTTYQVYYHMAYNTLSNRLRVLETPVEQGEFIGIADNTGASTGHHLHFHVYATKTQADFSWGYSVDIAFADVSDNGGRPRTCAEAAAYPNLGAQCQSGDYYTSGNTPRYPPSGALNGPLDRTLVTGSTINVSGTASDDIGISRIQVLGNYDGTWKTIDDIAPTTGAWAKDVDLCAAKVPDGPFGLTVRIFDIEGSRAANIPVRQMIKNFSCDSGLAQPPPPVCAPSENEVALYADTDFRGDCQKFSLNDALGTAYNASNLGSVGNNNTASIQVGSAVRAVLFDRGEDAGATITNGRSETFEASDASLSDNRIGLDRVSGVFVESRGTTPDEPFFHAPFGNAAASGINPSSVDSLVLSWEGGAGGTSYDVSLSGPGTSISTNVKGNALPVGNLAAGNYTFNVKAVNGAGGNTTSRSFTVSPGSLPAGTVRTAPYQESFETSNGEWNATGLWRYDTVNFGNWGATKAWVFNNGTDYATSASRAGDLTSPQITIPSSGSYFLRFSFYADVEDGNPFWDQRWVQVSVNGGPFTNLRQMTGDKQAVQSWLNSPAIPLQGMNGKTIRVRFHFDTIDEDNNSGKGWVVDDVSINNQAPDSSCADNNAIVDLPMNATLSGVICPEGDVDLYRISVTARQAFKVDIDARTLNPASKLDSIIYLLSDDGSSVIAENDDEKYGSVVDSLLSYVPNRTGYYYVKVKPWDYPGAGGPNHFYNISLKPAVAGQAPSSVSILYPLERTLVPAMPFEISASAMDYDGGSVRQVDFYWHGSDWSQPNWTKVGTDSNPNDGWTVIIDPLKYGLINGGALYVQATGQMGGVKGIAMWDLRVDDTPPVSQMAALPGVTHSTAIQVNWNGSDNSGEIDHFNLQYQVNGGAWANWTGATLTGNMRTTWVVGTPGATMGFRIRAVDRSGNEESFPAAAEVSTTIEASCTPDSGEVAGQSTANATPLTVGSVSSTFNLCKSGNPGSGDEDWFSFNGDAGQPLMIIGVNRGGGAGLSINLYDANGGTIGGWSSVDMNGSAAAKFTLPASGTYYIKVKALNGGVFGTDASYQIATGRGSIFYMPVIQRYR